MSIRYFILGLLTRQPMSGYDIKRCLEDFEWLISSPSFGTLYPALHMLLEDGLVSMDLVPNEGRPPRKVYSVTLAGRQALQGWVDESLEDDLSLKSFLMRLMLAENLSQAELVDCLQQRRSQVALHQRCLEEDPPEGEEGGADLGRHLAQGYGRSIAAAELAWLDRAIEGLSQTSISLDSVERETPVQA